MHYECQFCFIASLKTSLPFSITYQLSSFQNFAVLSPTSEAVDLWNPMWIFNLIFDQPDPSYIGDHHFHTWCQSVCPSIHPHICLENKISLHAMDFFLVGSFWKHKPCLNFVLSTAVSCHSCHSCHSCQLKQLSTCCGKPFEPLYTKPI